MRTCAHKDLTSEIVQACHTQFHKLPKHGKPVKRSNGQGEWTILAGIVMATPHDNQQSAGQWDLKCISIGWCLDELHACIQDKKREQNVFRYIGYNTEVPTTPLFELVHAGTQFHLYVSQAPCGDATTASMAQVQSEESKNAFYRGQSRQDAGTDLDIPTGSKRSQVLLSNDNENNTTDELAPPKKVQRNQDDEQQLDDSTVQEKKAGCAHALGFRRGRIHYDAVGVLRTKPGRVDSEPTLSMSCSDKIARWNILGLTCALVAPFLAPIYLTSVITKELFDKEALERALFKRMETCDCFEKNRDASEVFKLHRVNVHCTDIPFEFSKEQVVVNAQSQADGRVATAPVASACSISWISRPTGSGSASISTPEVLANGCKAGASAKKQIPAKARSRLCKLEMMQKAVSLWGSVPPSDQEPDIVRRRREQSDRETEPKSTGSESGSDQPDPVPATYRAWKEVSRGYVQARGQLLETVFRGWRGSSSSGSGSGLDEFTL
ncbi:hypothetical protein BG004_001165 [Podila humilis]|nr:hypothetical protein BG004_001165 [Podila humilis]